MRKTRVYIAGPYSRPDPCANTHAAIAVADQLLEAGYAPYVPHLTLLWSVMSPKPYEQWLDYDNQFLPCCDVVLRLPGASSGADKETTLAANLGIPVYGSFDELSANVSTERS